MSNNSGMMRALSPVSAGGMPGDPGFDVLSGYEGFNAQEQYDQGRMFSPVYGRDESPSLSPVNMRPGQKGANMTQYGNFLY